MTVNRSFAWGALVALAAMVSGRAAGPFSKPGASGELSAPGDTEPVGIIAYVRGGREIRLIAPDGTGDRLLWSHPQATKDLGINGLAWRPDGTELAFTSGHAAATSLYHSDVYAVRPDGTGFRKITNPPDRGEFGRYPKGTVTVP